MGIGSRVRFHHRPGDTGTVVALRSVYGGASVPGRWHVEATVRLDTGGITYAYTADLERLEETSAPSPALHP